MFLPGSASWWELSAGLQLDMALGKVPWTGLSEESFWESQVIPSELRTRQVPLEIDLCLQCLRFGQRIPLWHPGPVQNVGGFLAERGNGLKPERQKAGTEGRWSFTAMVTFVKHPEQFSSMAASKLPAYATYMSSQASKLWNLAFGWFGLT